jgi:hypothetical protein
MQFPGKILATLCRLDRLPFMLQRLKWRRLRVQVRGDDVDGRLSSRAVFRHMVKIGSFRFGFVKQMKLQEASESAIPDR